MNNNTMIAGFRTVQTSRGTVTTTEDAQLQPVRTCARIGVRHALGYPPNEADAYDRDALRRAQHGTRRQRPDGPGQYDPRHHGIDRWLHSDLLLRASRRRRHAARADGVPIPTEIPPESPCAT